MSDPIITDADRASGEAEFVVVVAQFVERHGREPTGDEYERATPLVMEHGPAVALEMVVVPEGSDQ